MNAIRIERRHSQSMVAFIHNFGLKFKVVGEEEDSYNVSFPNKSDYDRVYAFYSRTIHLERPGFDATGIRF